MTDYTTLADFKLFARITSTDSNDDDVISAIISASSAYIDQICGRSFVQSDTDETRVYDVPLGDTLLFDVDFMTVSSVTNGNGTALTTSNYILLPTNKTPKWGIKLLPGNIWLAANSNPYQCITIKGKLGASASAPADIVQDCKVIAKNAYNRRFGENMTGSTLVTSAGVLIMPEDIPQSTFDNLVSHRRVGFA